MSIDTLFEKKPHLDVNLIPGTVLLPNKLDNDDNVLKVPIVFTPREFIKYEEKITLDINNGLH